MAALDRRVKSTGLRVLVLISGLVDAGGAARPDQGQLAALLGLQRSNVSRAVVQLAQLGYLTRTPERCCEWDRPRLAYRLAVPPMSAEDSLSVMQRRIVCSPCTTDAPPASQQREATHTRTGPDRWSPERRATSGRAEGHADA